MRVSFIRLLALTASVAFVLSCEGGVESPTFGNGIGGGGGNGSTNQPQNPNAPDTTRPFTIIDTPSTGQLVNAGDSILVVTRIHDERALAGVTITGFKVTGDVNLGNLQRVIRYTAQQAPIAGETFPANLNDTTIRRYLHPAVPVDTTPDSNTVIMVITQDAAGNVDTVQRKINIVTGPRVTVLTPAPNDSVPQGIAMAISVNVAQQDGVDSVKIRIRGDTGFTGAARLDTLIVRKYIGAQTNITLDTSVMVPPTAPLKGRITITASATDKNRNPGSATPIVVFVRAPGATIPHVTQDIAARLETTDSVTVHATGDGIAALGYEMKDINGNVIAKDSVVLTAPFTSNATKRIALFRGFTIANRDAQQGKTVNITTFAVDQSGSHGYSVRDASATSQNDSTLAFAEQSIIVFGHTYPLLRPGTVGDIAVDEARSHVFVSNLSFNELDVFTGTATGGSFFSSGIPVGSEPWGISTTATSKDSLLVANSGGTNLSKVFIGSNNVANMKEDLTHRVRTRIAPLWVVLEALNVNTNEVTLTLKDPVLLSNRPQYVGQITDNAGYNPVFYSTRPTSEAPKGIIHWFDPNQAAPDLRTIISYTKSDEANYVLSDVDSVLVHQHTAGAVGPDTIFICDHVPGTNTVGVCIQRPEPAGGSTAIGVGAAVAAIQAAVGSDVITYRNVNTASIGITDTTFVATSGDRNWIAFGYGDTPGAGNIVMAAANPRYFSAIVAQKDLTNNAAEHIYGLALDSTGTDVAAHGGESYFAAVDDPFHLRLQGKYSTFSSGAGIAFHPAERGLATPSAQRLAFVASDNLSIEILDVAHFLSAGSLPIRGKLYGPLRVTRRFPTDPADVVLKLYGVTSEGLVVLDVRDANVSPVAIRAP